MTEAAPARTAQVSRLDEDALPDYLPAATRVLCNGKTLAFQARDTGSIPVTRSIPFTALT